MPLTSFKQVQDFFNDILTANQEMSGVPGSPHQAFWTTLSYNDFVSGNVPGVTDDNGNPIPILVKGDSAKSNLIQALEGTGPLFGPQGSIGQMPANGPPMFTSAQIQELASWIDAGCPQ